MRSCKSAGKAFLSKTILVGCGLLLVAGSPRAAALMRSESSTVPKGSCTGLRIDNPAGELEIRGEEREDVFIDIQFRVRGSDEAEIAGVSDKLSLAVEPAGDWLRLIPRYDGRDIFSRKHEGLLKRVSIRSLIKVRAPRDFNVEASNADGDIGIHDIGGDVKLVGASREVEVRRVRGRCEIELTSGNVELEDLGDDVVVVVTSGIVKMRRIDGNVRVRGSSGTLEARDLAGNLIVQTESGDVRAVRVEGDMSLASTYGAIRVDSPGALLQARTSNGDIVVSGAGAPGQSCRLTSSSGDIEVALLAEADYEVDLSTSSGAIHWKLPLRVRDVSRQSLLGILGEGRDLFQVVTASGDIRIHPTED